MSIAELTVIVPRPDGVKKPSKKNWKSIESQLQLTLPKDLNDIISAYGSGTFVDRGRHWIKIYNPCSAEYLDVIAFHRTNLEAFKAGEGDDFVTYPVFPSKPGLLGCGSDANGNEIYWLTEGNPEKWPVVIRTPSNEYEQFPGPLSSFLSKAFRREITVEAWPATFFMKPENLQFDSAQPTAPKSSPRSRTRRSIAELTAIVPPPEESEKPSSETWKLIEKRLRLTLPKNLNDIVSAYGSGTFVDGDGHWIKIYNPYSAEYLEYIIYHRTNLQALQAEEGNEFIPYPVFPSKPGLLGCGCDGNGNAIYWLTEGEPENWPLVIRTPSNDYEQFPSPLSSFLAKVFRREIVVKAWPATNFMNPENLHFDPAQPPAPKADPRTVYELYVLNGNKAGFWARHVWDQVGCKLLIREIDGKTSGKLPGIPVEYNRAPITADSYVGKTLSNQNVDMSCGWHQMYEFFNWSNTPGITAPE